MSELQELPFSKEEIFEDFKKNVQDRAAELSSTNAFLYEQLLQVRAEDICCQRIEAKMRKGILSANCTGEGKRSFPNGSFSISTVNDTLAGEYIQLLSGDMDLARRAVMHKTDCKNFLAQDSYIVTSIADKADKEARKYFKEYFENLNMELHSCRVIRTSFSPIEDFVYYGWKISVVLKNKRGKDVVIYCGSIMPSIGGDYGKNVYVNLPKGTALKAKNVFAILFNLAEIVAIILGFVLCRGGAVQRLLYMSPSLLCVIISCFVKKPKGNLVFRILAIICAIAAIIVQPLLGGSAAGTAMLMGL